MWTASCVINTFDTATCVACLLPFLIGSTGSKKDEEKEKEKEERRRRKRRHIQYEGSITSIVLFLLHNFIVFDNGQVNNILGCISIIY